MYYYSTMRLILVPGRMDGWVDLDTAVSVQSVPKAAYRSDFVWKKPKLWRGFDPGTSRKRTRPRRPAQEDSYTRRDSVFTANKPREPNYRQCVDHLTFYDYVFRCCSQRTSTLQLATSEAMPTTAHSLVDFIVHRSQTLAAHRLTFELNCTL